MRRPPPACAILCLLGAVLRAQVATPPPAAPHDAPFLAGYAAAVLEREFSLSATGLTVEGGAIRYLDRGFGRLERDQIRRSLRTIPGVRSVRG